MTRNILIGKDRRITLDELLDLSRAGGDARLEMHGDDVAGDDSANGGNDDAWNAAIARASPGDGGTLSAEATVASLALLSHALAQGRLVRGDRAGRLPSALVGLANRSIAGRGGGGLELPTDADGFAGAVDSLVGDPSLRIAGDRAYLPRLVSLARISLALARARSLSSRSVSDPIAALSVERLGRGLTLEPFSARNHDELRPHGGCVESASVLRACLQGTTMVGSDDKAATGGGGATGRSARYALTTPQYHGPAREAIAAACKAVELEANCSGTGEDGGLDDTVALLAGNSALGGVLAMVNGSGMRSGGEGLEAGGSASTLEESAAALENFVALLQTSLEDEAELGCRFVDEEMSRREAEVGAKEAEKARRAAERGGDADGNPKHAKKSGKDEFANMSEAQKAKVLKKRAEKEAKAAAKRRAKEARAAGGGAALPSVFGAGAAAVHPLLSGAGPDLSDPVLLSRLGAAVDALLSGGARRTPKVAKGTRDYLPEQMDVRSRAFAVIRRVFARHGAVEIDTPVFELKETLTGKYGEDSKLIYDLADQGGEALALRYDLTVPFARFLASNAVGNIRRYHVGKVYRRDQPALSKGRYREFYQCDFDIAGTYGRMVPDAECLAVACEILDELPIGDFGIKLNHRGLLDAVLDICGVPAEKFRAICSAVDKLDKEPWEEVRREMVEEKGLGTDVADRIGEFVVLKGEPWGMYKMLMDGKKFGEHGGALRAMEDLRICFEYLEAMDKLKFISFDLSLARGLDYYTGVIYEAVCMNGNTQVGSIGGGGRYDNLVSMFQEAGKVTPCVGVSVGIERVFTLMEERLRQEQGGSIKRPNVSVLVASAGENLLRERMKLAKVLWDANISAEFSQQENPKLKFEIAGALDRRIPFMAIVGEEEAREGKCKVKDLGARTEETVDVGDLARVLRGKGVVPVGCEFAMEMLKEEQSSIEK